MLSWAGWIILISVRLLHAMFILRGAESEKKTKRKTTEIFPLLLIKKENSFLPFSLVGGRLFTTQDWCWWWRQNECGKWEEERKNTNQKSRVQKLKLFALSTSFVLFHTVVSRRCCLSFNLINYTFCCLKCS